MAFASGERVELDHYRWVDAADWRWPSFQPWELASRKSGRLVVVPDFLDRLQTLRDAFRRPMVLTSGYRTPQENADISSSGDVGPHTTGRAVDVRISGSDAYALVGLAIALGFTGIGVAQKGLHARRFVHLDDLPASGAGPARPRPTIWSY